MTLRTKIAATLLLLLIALAALLLALPNHSYATQDRTAILAPASPAHSTGTDQLGRDRTTRLAAALLIGLTGATLAAALTTAIAAAIGTTAAFAPPAIAWALMLLSDAFLALPWLFLLMIVRSGIPLTTSPARSATITFLILAALGWPACARAIYRGTLHLKSSDWLIHARALGLRNSQLARRHLLPHLRPLLIPQFLICVPAFLVAEANLGTLGLGIAEPLPSWGTMLLELDSSGLLAHSAWLYLPIAMLVLVLLLLEALAPDSQ